MTEKHCPTCVCGRRAPVQSGGGKGPGTISWAEHEAAAGGYSARFRDQDSEEIAARGGFGYDELVMFLGREPETWAPRGRGAERTEDQAE